MFYLGSDSYGINKTIFDGWYTDKIYNVNGETYAICSENLSGCTSYTSYERAQKACNKLNERICNYVFTEKKLLVISNIFHYNISVVNN